MNRKNMHNSLNADLFRTNGFIYYMCTYTVQMVEIIFNYDISMIKSGRAVSHDPFVQTHFIMVRVKQ